MQSYASMELIIVNDNSSDSTSDYLKGIDDGKRIISEVKNTENSSGKRAALWLGIEKARHNRILLTDADCRPRTPDWAMAMVAQADVDEADIVLGYSPSLHNGTTVGAWAHYETWITAVQYLSYAHRGLPYMGVGRNMSYPKRLITENVRSRHLSLASGDDDLTIQQIATSENTTICLDPRSFVDTDAPVCWRAYFRQKTRHLSTGHAYNLRSQMLLSTYAISQSLFVLLTVVCAIYGHFDALWYYGLRLVIILPVVYRLKKTMEASFSLMAFILYDLGLAIYYLIFSFAVFFPQKNKW